MVPALIHLLSKLCKGAVRDEIVVHLGVKLVLPCQHFITAALPPPEDDQNQLSPLFVCFFVLTQEIFRDWAVAIV